MSIDLDDRQSGALQRTRQVVNKRQPITARITLGRHLDADLFDYMALETGQTLPQPRLAALKLRIEDDAYFQLCENEFVRIYADPALTYLDFVIPPQDQTGVPLPGIFTDGVPWATPSYVTAAIASGGGAYATAEQGAKADTALQPAAIGTTVQGFSSALTTFATNGSAYYLARANHTGTQLASTISDFTAAALLAVTFSTLTGKPTTLAGYGITDATSNARSAISLTTTGTSGASTYNSTTGVLNVPQYANSGGTVTSVTAGTGLSGGTFTTTGTISLPNTGTAGTGNTVTTDAQGRVTALSTTAYLTGNQAVTLSGDATGSGTTAITVTLAAVVSAGTYTGVTVNAKGLVTAGTVMAFSNAPARSIVTTAAAANGWQISATLNALVTYSVIVTCAVQIGVATNVEGYVVLERSATNSATASDWKECGRVTNGNLVGLAVALSLTQKSGSPLFCGVPAGYYVRLRSVNTAGTPVYTYVGGDEVTM